MKHSLILLLLLLLIPLASCRKDHSPLPAKEDVVYSEKHLEEIPPEELELAPAEPVGSDSLALVAYRYTWTDSKDIPPLVIIIDDFGNSGGKLLEDFAALPSELVFAVLPDLDFTEKSGKIAAQHGHEVIIHIPMQANSANANPGKNHVKVSSTQEEIAALLDSFYEQLPMAIAANNHMGSAITADRTAMTTVLNHLNSRGLFFVDSVTTAASVVPALAQHLGYPVIKRDIFLDVPDNSDATLAAKINELGRFKGRSEPVVIITHCHNRQKLDALVKFIAQVQAMGLRIIPLAQAVPVSA